MCIVRTEANRSWKFTVSSWMKTKGRKQCATTFTTTTILTDVFCVSLQIEVGSAMFDDCNKTSPPVINVMTWVMWMTCVQRPQNHPGAMYPLSYIHETHPTIRHTYTIYVLMIQVKYGTYLHYQNTWHVVKDLKSTE